MTTIDMIISGGIVLTMNEGEEPITDGAVAIAGEEIVAVGRRTDLEDRFMASKRIEAARALVMPGLINGHTHAPMIFFRGLADDLELMDWLNNYIFPAEARFVNKDFSYLGTLLACAEMIKSGTTTFCDMYIFEDEVARAAAEAGMRCLVGEGLFDFPSPNAKTPAEGLAYTESLIAKWSGHPLVSVAVMPHSLYSCSEELISDARALASCYGVPLATHYLETKTECERLVQLYGRSPTHYLQKIGALNERFLAFHAVWMNEEDIAIFASHGCRVVHNPESNMKLASGVAPAPEMHAAGIITGLGTDGCASNNNLDLFQEMDTAAKLHKVHRLDPTVMDAQTVLRMATCDGARALGLDDRVGRLAPGMKADIIVINLDKPHLTPLYNVPSQLVYAANGSDVETVLVNGKILMRDRKLCTIDVEQAMSRVRAISAAIVEEQHCSRREAGGSRL